MIEALLDRLEAMHAEIPGIVTAFRDPPPLIKQDALPCIYAVDQGWSNEALMGGDATRSYQILVEVLVVPIYQNTLTAEGASQAAKATTTLNAAIDNYYNTHRMMRTSSLSTPPTGVTQPFVYTNEGVVVPLVAHDDGSYVGTRYMLTIDARIVFSEY